MASDGPSAVELMRALAAGPDGSSKAQEAWDRDWRPLFERAIQGEISDAQSADLAETLERLTASVAEARRAAAEAEAGRSRLAKRAMAKPPAGAGSKALAKATRSKVQTPIGRLAAGDEIKVRTPTGDKVVAVVGVVGSKLTPQVRVRYGNGREETISVRRLKPRVYYKP
ncbi:hypothetical protein [Streptomyces coeruleorubidus]|uniref:hypothetical protein n=1 Tax=Streptomyces coeruleorubidus TaxID=116188 RepID=UPI003649EEB8